MFNFVAVMSAINMALGFIFRSVIIKFAYYFALYFFVTEAINYLSTSNIFPNSTNMYSFMAGLSPQVWWGLDLVAFDVVFPMILGAYVTRMLITMIPVVGPKG